ncbi:GAF domain-containing protein [Streptosporangium sp. NPDC000509]|uniref:GAF domain-containing protein n=1 Tax=Streptosporangium sp. NPDC000509 TaxID=3366186 RepID=UPI0036878CEA
MSRTASVSNTERQPADKIMERLLDGTLTENEIRAPILNSWRRCQATGLPPGGFQTRLLDDLNYDSPLIRAARPVLDRLRTTIAGTSSGVFLSDSSGVLFLRALGDTSMRAAADANGVIPGFSYAESDIGTNAVGSTLLERRTYQVSGNEHLWEKFHKFAAVGTPILNPLSGRVEGVMCVAALDERANAQMTAVAQRSAHDIEQRLLEFSAERERALLKRFLSAAQESGTTHTASGSMPSDLCHRDRIALEDVAVRLVAQGREATVDIPLSDGRTATVAAQLVTYSTDLTGIAVQAWLSERTPRTPPKIG